MTIPKTLTAAFATDLTAATDDDGNRTLKGTLLPFNEPGYTNVGTVVISPGAIAELPEIILNLQHDRRTLIGKSVAITETETALEATFSIVKTRSGDDALEEVAAGLRSGFSVELTDLEFSDDWVTITGARLTGAALVDLPAFESAKLAASLAPPIAPESAPSDTEKETPMTDARTSGQAATIDAAKPVTISTAAELVAGAQHSKTLLAALADIIPDSFADAEQPEYIGELWKGKSFQRRVIPRFGSKPLTARKIKGWRWVTKPEVGPYAGDKTQIPTGTIETEPVEFDAKRIAGGHDIDRAFTDFDNPEFWEAYWSAMTESYARQSDAGVLSDIVAAATPVTRGTVPASVNPGLVSIADGLLSILNETDSLADTAFIAPDLWRDMLLTREDDRLAYLDAALGVEEGSLTAQSFKIIPESRLDPGTVLVTTKEAATVRELGSGVPIRVEALNVALGGIDAAVFGYYGVNIHNKAGLALVTAGE